MPKLPMVTAKVIIRFLNSLDFELKRQKGSHKFFSHPDGRTATVPDHPRRRFRTRYFKKIIK